MKLQIKIYLEPNDYAKLKAKAIASGFAGRGNISHYIEKVARTDIAFLDVNVKAILSILPLSLKQPRK